MARPNVLIVDDHADFRAFASGVVEADGCDVVAEAQRNNCGSVHAAPVRLAAIDTWWAEPSAWGGG